MLHVLFRFICNAITCGIVVVFQKTVNIKSASETFDVNIKKDLGLSDNEGSTAFDIEVEFTETLTKKSSKVNENFYVVKYSYEGIFTGEYNYRPNTLYSFKISLRKFDGTSVRLHALLNSCQWFELTSFSGTSRS